MSKSIIKQKRILTKAGGGSSISTPVSVANGGTGLASYAIGDIIYASGTTTLSKLAIGTANQQLRVNAGGTALEYFTPTSGGITVGTTTIASGTAGRLLYQNASNVVGQSASYYIDDNTATNYRVLLAPGKATASFTGNYLTFIGYNAGAANTTGSSNVAVGSGAMGTATNATNNVAVGHNALTSTNVEFATAVGSSAGRSNTGGHYGIYLGYSAGQNSNNESCIFIMATNNVASTANHQGFLAGNTSTSYVDNWFYNGITHSSAYSTVLNACGGSGTNNAGANFTIATGRGTGNVATGGDFIVQTSDAGASSSTAQTLTTKFTVKKSGSIEVTKSINTTSGDSATIDKVAGRFRKDNSGTTFTLTNALITANSIILLTPIQVDLTAMSWGVAAGAGSCVITFNAAPTADFDMNFLIIN